MIIYFLSMFIYNKRSTSPVNIYGENLSSVSTDRSILRETGNALSKFNPVGWRL